VQRPVRDAERLLVHVHYKEPFAQRSRFSKALLGKAELILPRITRMEVVRPSLPWQSRTKWRARVF